MDKKDLYIRFFGTGILIICILLVAANQNATAEENGENEILMNFSFSEPLINVINISNSTYHEVLMNGTTSYGDVNQPILPVKPLSILLPQKGILKSINVTCEGNISLDEGFNVTLGNSSTNFSEGNQNQTNESGFNTSIAYPTESYSCYGVSYFRGYSILEFCIYPVYYIGDTGEIYYYEYMNVTITTNDSGSVHSLFRGLEKDEKTMKQIVDDYSMNSTYTSIPDPPKNTSLINSDDEYDYLILTSNKVVNPEAPIGVRDWYTFQDLAQYKNESGIKTIVKMVEDIYASGEYDGDDNQETIRNYIQHAYSACGIEYVLLGGDTFVDDKPWKEIIPARNLFYWYNVMKGVLPSDLYYACLDGSYNENNDSIYGEDPFELWGTSFDGGIGGDWYEPPLKVGTGGIQANYFYGETDPDENNKEFDVGLFTPSLNLKDSTKAYIRFSCYGILEENVSLSVNAFSEGIEGISDFQIVNYTNEIIIRDENILRFNPSNCSYF